MNKINLLMVAVFSVLLISCSKSDLVSPTANYQSEDPAAETSVRDLNECYSLGERINAHHIVCDRGGKNCYKDFLDGNGVRGVVPTEEQIKWYQEGSNLKIIIDIETFTDTLEVNLI